MRNSYHEGREGAGMLTGVFLGAFDGRCRVADGGIGLSMLMKLMLMK